ncbi:MAG: ATP-binding protein [Oscillospiraceae bacterium]|nr:ATP-binding protein [Oscillospiraceae bacterium]
MTKRIFLSTFFVSFASVIIAIIIVLGANYAKNLDNFTKQLEEETGLLSVSLADENADDIENNLAKLSGFSSRITYIAADGTVLFDNKANPAEMENHANRDEIIAAKQSGKGTATRESHTLSERTIYCARVLENGDIIRVSGTQDTVLGMIFDLWWGVLLALILALILSLLLADLTANKIVKPINKIDLKNPDIDENYSEIAPLLHEIKNRNIEIESRMNELSRARAEFSLITENMSEGFIITDKNADVLSYNNSALKILGAEFNENSRNIFTLNRSESFIEAIENALKGERNEVNLTLSDRVYQVIASPVFSHGEPSGAIIIILDITEKESREELRREFTSNVSHELKTPLTTIYGISDMLAGGIVKPEDIKEFSGKIKSEASRLITLIEDIINLSRLDENSYKEERETVDLHELAETCADRLSKAAENAGVSLSVTGEKAEIIGIYPVLDEIFYNLLDNAIKYNKEGGTAEINISQTDDFVKATFTDTGIGIPPESVDRVFERFYRVDKSRSRKIGGTGLGLSIVKHGVTLHGGTIGLKSTENSGTEITVLLPKHK